MLVIVGPTAVGKTALCVDLAKHLQTDIISADSRQFYKELAIGTAKPSVEEQGGVKHHFIDSHSVEEYFSPGDFERKASILLETLFQNHEVVIATGGSGLYLKALIEGLDEMPEADLALRETLNARLEKEGLWALYSELKQLDSVYAVQVDSKNPQRVIRALEVCLSTGKPYSEFRLAQKPERPFQVIKICLERPREELYARIDQRMDQMLTAGLVAEARAFADKQHLYALKTLGYKEVYGFLRGEYDEAEMIRLLKRNNRHYAKKQMTWFRNQDEFTYLHPSNAFVEILKKLEA